MGKDGHRLSVTAAAGLTFLSCLVMAAAVSAVEVGQTVAFAAFALAVALVAWWVAPVGAIVAALLGFLFADGFAVDSAGTLDWHGSADLLRLAALVGLAVTASLLGRRNLHSERPGPRAPRGGNGSG